MVEKPIYNPEENKEEEFVGQMLPELLVFKDKTRGVLLVLGGEKETDPKGFKEKCSVVEQALGAGYSIDFLVSNKIIMEQSFLTLLQEYDSQRRPDPNNYQKQIKKYFENSNNK